MISDNCVVYHYVRQATAANGLTVWSGDYEKIFAKVTEFSSPMWFDRREELEAKHPEFVGSSVVVHPTQMKWAWPISEASK